MTLQAFIEKLQRLDSRIYLDTSRKAHVYGDWSVVALMARKQKSDSKSNYSSLSGDAARFLAAKESGNADEHLGSVSWPEVPERSIIIENREIARGWRESVLQVVNKGYGSLDKAKKIFSRSLGETPYDRMSFREKASLTEK